MPTGAASISVKFKQGQQNPVGVPSAWAAVVAVTERGPFTRQTVTSPEGYQKLYGGIISATEAEVPKQIKQFFDCGGTVLDIQRTCHYTDIDDSTTYTAVKGSKDIPNSGTAATSATLTSTGTEDFALVNGDDLDIEVDGGGPNTATFTAVAAFRDDTTVYPVAPIGAGTNMTVAFDGGAPQTVTAVGGETTALDVANMINSQITGGSAFVVGAQVRIQSDTEGLNSIVDIQGGGIPDLTLIILFTTGPTAPTASNVDDISTVTGAEVVALCQAAWAGELTPSAIEATGQVTLTTTDTGVAATLQITGGTARTKIGFDNLLHTGADATPQNTLKMWGKTEGAYANNISAVVAAASNGDAEYFNLSVSVSGTIQEVFENLTMDSTAERYVLTIVNHTETGSNLIALTDYDLITGFGLTPTQARPANATHGPMVGGSDGLVGIVDTDFVGTETGKTGLYSFDSNLDITMVSIPGRAAAAIHAGLNTYVSHREKAIYAVHPTPTAASVASASAMRTYAISNTYGTSEFGCISWPRIKVANPNTAVLGTAEQIAIGPEMSKMGRFSYNDRFNPDGVFVSTAGIKDARGEIPNCLGLEVTLDSVNGTGYKSNRDLLADKNVEPIVKFENTNYHFDGGDNLLTTGDWPRQWHARGVIYIVQTLKRSSLWVKHSKNNPKNRGEWERMGTRFLDTIPADAFDEERPTFWQVNEKLNDAAVRNAKRMVGRLGLGFADDAKYVEIEVTRTLANAA